MCARYTLSKEEKKLLQAYEAKLIAPFEPSFNIAPTQTAALITADEPEWIQQFHFGLVPFWAKDKKVGVSMLNARSETLLEKPAFKPLLLQNKRCLVLADGFYEWKTEGKEKLPYRFILKTREVFAFAGLWSQWIDPVTKDPYRSFTILTTSPNDDVAELHNRMPVILSKEEEKVWLDGSVNPNDLLSLCDSYPADDMEKYRVSKEVNKVVNNHCNLILPANSE